MTNHKNEIKCSSTSKSLVTFVRKKQLTKIESIEGFRDPLTEMSTPSPGWANCPIDVLFLVFEQLCPKDLMSCIRVNNWWRDAVDYMGEVRLFIFIKYVVMGTIILLIFTKTTVLTLKPQIYITKLH